MYTRRTYFWIISADSRDRYIVCDSSITLINSCIQIYAFDRVACGYIVNNRCDAHTRQRISDIYAHIQYLQTWTSTRDFLANERSTSTDTGKFPHSFPFEWTIVLDVSSDNKPAGWFVKRATTSNKEINGKGTSYRRYWRADTYDSRMQRLSRRWVRADFLYFVPTLT